MTSSPLDRRAFLRGGALGAAGLVATGTPAAWARTRPVFRSSPWALGVASGDPSANGVVLWTRLTTDSLGTDRIPADRIRVEWEIADDERFTKVVQRGAEVAERRDAHSVHVEVEGLQPGREYWYRFRTGSEISPAGRTKTAPAIGASPASLSFAFASCQQYEHGYFDAWADVAKQDLDVVLHLGDYIYEYATDDYTAPGGNVRHHVGREIESLFDYRRRHAQYRSDPDLQAAHAMHPFVVIWDDHEVDNNYADLVSEETGTPQETFARRRAAAYKSYFEHMPLRRAQRDKGPNLLLDRTLNYGDLAQFTMLDTRQYRSDQANGDGTKPPSPEWADPARTFLGARQEKRVLRDLERSPARWNVIGNQIPLTAFDQTVGPELGLYMDGWAGYPAARERFLTGLKERRVRNPLVVTGDVHASWACEVNEDVQDPSSTAVAAEFIGTSITSGGDGTDTPSPLLAENPQVKWQRSRRGYVKVTLDRAQAKAEYRHLRYVKQKGSPVNTEATFVVADGSPKLQQV